MSEATQALARSIGERIRELREEAGLRQDDIAKAAKIFGLGWARSSVAQLERGTRDLAAYELLLLPHVLAEALGWEPGWDYAEELAALYRGVKIARRRRQAEKADDQPDEAEAKAARRLGDPVGPLQVVVWGRDLWGRRLSAERDRRVAQRADEDTTPRRLQALRGHVTRELIEELRVHLASRRRS